jgi:hypothetical protein
MFAALVGCDFYSQYGSKSDKTRNENIILEGNFESIDSIKAQIDMNAKDKDSSYELAEVSIDLVNTDLNSGTAYFVYYTGNDEKASKLTYTVDVSENKITASREQKGTPEDVGSVTVGEINVNLIISNALSNLRKNESFIDATSKLSSYKLEIRFSADRIVSVTAFNASDNESVFTGTL